MGCHFLLQCRKVKYEREVSQSCPTLRDPMDCSLPGSSVYGVVQARLLEWGAIAFSEYMVYIPFNHHFGIFCMYISFHINIISLHLQTFLLDYLSYALSILLVFSRKQL